LQITVCLFVVFLLFIVLSALLRFIDFDYPFGIFKLFLQLLTTSLISSNFSLSCTQSMRNFLHRHPTILSRRKKKRNIKKKKLKIKTTSTSTHVKKENRKKKQYGLVVDYNFRRLNYNKFTSNKNKKKKHILTCS